MIAFLFVCILIGMVLAFFAAPIIMVTNRQKLKEMDAVLEQYRCLPAERQQSSAVRLHYREKLIALKNCIFSVDKQAVEAARDKLSLV